jgi:hypothetical protein
LIHIAIADAGDDDARCPFGLPAFR